MDEIKTNIEKIFDQFSDSIASAIPKRLSFDNGDDSTFRTQKPIKRKAESFETPDVSLCNKKVKDDSTNNSINSSFNSSVISSPWEARRIKSDLIESKSLITQLRQEIEQKNVINEKMKLMYSGKVSGLEKQLNQSEARQKDLDKHLNAIRKREQVTRDDLSKAKNLLCAQKTNFDEKINQLESLNCELEANLCMTKHEFNNEISDLQRTITEFEQNLLSAQEELEAVSAVNETLSEKAESFDELQKRFEVELQKLSTAQLQIKDLEYKIASHDEWKEISKASQAKISNMPDLEKELIRLRKENKNLRDAMGNKLLLEERVFDLKSRLARYENSNSNSETYKVQIHAMEQELKNWKSVAADHCLPNTPVNPVTLRSRFEQILQKDLLLTSEKSNGKCEKNSLLLQNEELLNHTKILTKNNEDLKTSHKRNQAVFKRIQKKLFLVARERDCYKELIDNYEKDLTISGPIIASSPEAQLRFRLEMMEKSLTEYKELCSSLEKEFNGKEITEITFDSSANNEQFDKLRKELVQLQTENEQIRRKKEDLELELEHRNLRGDFNINKFKVVHMEMNPATEAHEAHKNEIEKLQAEIERLRRKNRKLDEEHAEITMRFNDTNLTMNIHETNVLRSQIESLESRTEHMKEAYKEAQIEFRDVCYMLFGYRIDRDSIGNYTIANMYADSEDDVLKFRMNELRVLDMLKSDYSDSLIELIETFITGPNDVSYPAFLSSLTLELYNRTTIMVA